jgi:hypothetical protein
MRSGAQPPIVAAATSGFIGSPFSFFTLHSKQLSQDCIGPQGGLFRLNRCLLH